MCTRRTTSCRSDDTLELWSVDTMVARRSALCMLESIEYTMATTTALCKTVSAAYMREVPTVLGKTDLVDCTTAG